MPAEPTPAALRAVGRRAALLVGTVVVCQVLGALGRGLGSGLPIPWPVLLLSIVTGCTTALFGIGIVLIYRSARIINFAHAGFGFVAAAVYYELQVYKGWPFAVAVACGLGAGVLAGLVTELVFIRRFTNSPRLVLTVATLGVGGLLGGIAASVPTLLGDIAPVSSIPTTPVSGFVVEVFPIVLTGAHLVLVAVTALVLAGFVVFFRTSSIGLALRGAAENSDRVALLGVKTSYLAPVVWGVAALLSSLAAVIGVMVSGYTPGAAAVTAVASPLLIRALAAAVIADMEDLPTVVVASVALAMVEQSTFFAFSQSALADGLVFVVIVGVLLARRHALARSDEAATGTWAASVEIRPIPPQLARLRSVAGGARRFQGLVVVALLGLPWVFDASQVGTASVFAIYGIIVTSLVVLTGWGGQISLGQFGFVAVGALVGGWIIGVLGWPFPVGLAGGTVAGGAAAVVVGLPALRIRGLFLAVTTLAFAVAARSVLLNDRYFGDFIATRVDRPRLLYLRFEDERAYYYLCLASLGAAVYVATRLRRSRVGRVLIAMRDNERTAQSFGINLVRTRLTTFAISGGLAAFAGVLLAGLQFRVNPEAYGPDQSVQLFLMTIIGGLGSVTGALTGAVYFGTLALASGNPALRLLGSAGGVLIVLLFFPTGIGGFLYSLRDSVLRRVAIRRRIYVPSLLGAFGLGEQMERAPLAPVAERDGRPVDPPRRYTLPSRIDVAGESQTGRRWTF